MRDIADRMQLARQFFELQPDAARVDDPTVRVEQLGPLRFRATDTDGHSVESDMPAEIGGAREAMAPGSLLRSALGTCDATRIAMEAAARGIELTRLEVEVSSSSDHRGLLGFDGVEAGPLRIHVRYRLASATAPDADLRSLIEAVEHHSPVLSALRRQVPVDMDIEIG